MSGIAPSLPYDPNGAAVHHTAYAFAHASEEDAEQVARQVIRSRRFDNGWTVLPNGRMRSRMMPEQD